MLSLNHSASHLSRTMASGDDTNTQQNTKEEKPNVQTLQIIVRAQDGSELQFKIKRTTPLMKVFVAYCSRKGLTLEDCRFVADGNLLTAKGNEVTPEEGFEQSDIILLQSSTAL